MRAYNFLLGLFFLCSLSLLAQEGESTKPYLTFKVGQSSSNSYTKGEPAVFTATYPANDTVDNSFLINGYAELAINFENTDWTFGIAGEVQKNTLIDKEQDVRQFGVTFGNNFPIRGKKSDPDEFGPDRPLKGLLVFSGSLKYSEDRVKETEAFQGHIGLTYEQTDNRAGIFNTKRFYPKHQTKEDFGYYLLFRHDYNFGLGYIGGDENVLFGKMNLQFNAHPLGGLMKKLLDQREFLMLRFTYDARAPFIGSTDLDEHPLRTFSGGIKYKIKKNNVVELSYNWNKGANPFAGLDNQEFETIVVKVSMDLNNKKGS